MSVDPDQPTPHLTKGEGFVMWFDGMPVEPVQQAQTEPPREVWPGIEDDVAELEKLLRY